MVDNPDYSVGTVSITTGTKVLTGVGTMWLSADLEKGDQFGFDGYAPARIDTINNDNSISLLDTWRGPTLTTSPYFIRYQADGSGLTGQSVALRRMLSQPLLTAFAGLTAVADKLMYFTGANTMALADFSAHARATLANAKAWTTSLFGLTGAVDQIPIFTGPNTMGLLDKSSLALRTDISVRNLFGNGNFELWQDGASFANPAHFTTIADRWVFGQSAGTAQFTLSRDTDVPNLQSVASMKVLVTTANGSPSALQEAHLRQSIEGRLSVNAFAGRDSTLSFWVKSNVVGTHACVFVKANAAQSAEHTYVASYTINAVDTWEYKVISVPLSTAPDQTWYSGNNYSLKFRFTFYAGSTMRGPLGWQAGGGIVGFNGGVNLAAAVNNYIKFAQVQFEPRPFVTPFHQEDLIDTLTKAQRYRLIIGGSGVTDELGFSGYATAAGEILRFTTLYPTTMRAYPTQTPQGTFQYANASNYLMAAGTNCCSHLLTSAAAGRVAVRSDTAARWVLSAEM